MWSVPAGRDSRPLLCKWRVKMERQFFPSTWHWSMASGCPEIG